MNLAFRTWLDWLFNKWFPRFSWASAATPGPCRPIRKFRPEVRQFEDRLVPGDAVSPASIALSAFGGGGGLFLQGLVRELVGGPNLVSPESISLTEPGARGDIASAVPPAHSSVADK